jgi:hypothetical protein
MDHIFVNDHHTLLLPSCPHIFYTAFGYNAVLLMDKPFVAVRFNVKYDRTISIMRQFLTEANLTLKDDVRCDFWNELQFCIDETITKASDDEAEFTELFELNILLFPTWSHTTMSKHQFTFYFLQIENNNFERTYHSKEFRLDEDLTILTVDIHEVEGIELLIAGLVELEDRVGENIHVNNLLQMFYFYLLV